jgi:quinol monooxygenase YgiN
MAWAAEPPLSPRTATGASVAETHPTEEWSIDMVSRGLIVRLEAKAGKEEDLAAFLAEALPLVQQEPETVAWFALRIDEASFAIVDVFPDEGGLRAHLAGPVASALSERAGELLATPPSIEPADVLAAKLPEEAGR